MTERGERILILAPLGRDAEMLASVLRGAGHEPSLCRDMDDVVREPGLAGALLVTEEALAPPAMARLAEWLDAQPPWSDLPIVLLTHGGRTSEPTTAVLRTFRRLGNVTFLERPVRVMTLVSTVESALRARRRQYEARDRVVNAEADSRAKDEFLAMLGHELRNPLAAISAASYLLDTTAPVGGDAAAPARRVIARQLRHLTRLVDDLLDVSRVTTGKIELALQPLDVAAAIGNCVAALRAAGRADGHTVDVALTPAWVAADEVRFDQIITNLLVNAVKYTPRGGRITVSAGPEDADVVIRVRDSGIGIAPELLPRVFDLFVQGGRAIERTEGGLGIGLTLVRRLVELHGGVVDASSEGPDRGSTFTVRLPAITPPSKPRASGVQNACLPPRRVLVVEDHDDTREMVAFMVKEAGHEVHVAADGASGLAAAMRERPDVAIIDVGLPRMNGYEVASGIRAAPWGTDMVLVALSGYGMPDDRRRALEAGFDRYLVKPIADVDELASVLAPRA
jgi:signal transduction histidine kinase